MTRCFSLLGKKFGVFLQRYFWGCYKSLAWQGDKGHSGQIQLFGAGHSSVPSSGSFLIASRFTPHALRVFPHVWFRLVRVRALENTNTPSHFHLRARATITSHFRIPSSCHLGPIFTRTILNVGCVFSDYAVSSSRCCRITMNTGIEQG
jgi:hypothetical protein